MFRFIDLFSALANVRYACRCLRLPLLVLQAWFLKLALFSRQLEPRGPWEPCGRHVLNGVGAMCWSCWSFLFSRWFAPPVVTLAMPLRFPLGVVIAAAAGFDCFCQRFHPGRRYFHGSMIVGANVVVNYANPLRDNWA